MLDLSRPLNLASADFAANKFEWLEQIREERPVGTARISALTIYTVARYDDCTALLKDPRVFRNRSTATGGSRFPFPLPKSVRPLAESMIQEDDPNHRRLRELVRRAFQPQAIERLESRIDAYAQELLDTIEAEDSFELQSRYALPIPLRMIGDLVGVQEPDRMRFQQSLSVLTKGFSGWRMLRTLIWDLPATIRFVRELVRAKRREPGEDLLTALLTVEHGGDRLTEDEVVAMVFLLMIGGFETTVHLISNGVLTLLEHPEALEQLRADSSLLETTVEEILRHRGPVQATKPGYASEDLHLHGEVIPKGKPIMPLLAAANHDPRAFADPQRFDITRTPNHHLGFGHGVHFCIGAHLARAETRIALRNLLLRFDNLRLAVPPAQLKIQAMPGWHRYQRVPLAIG